MATALTLGIMDVQSCLSKLLLFGKMDFGSERRIAAEMYERNVVAGEILIKEGDTGSIAAHKHIFLGTPKCSLRLSSHRLLVMLG